MIRKFAEHKKFQLVNNLCASDPFPVCVLSVSVAAVSNSNSKRMNRRGTDDYIIYGLGNNMEFVRCNNVKPGREYL